METEDHSFQFDLNSKRFTRRQVLKGAAVAGAGFSLAPLLAACGGGSVSPSASPSAAKKGGELNVGIVGGSANETLDGQLASTEPEIAITFQLYDALLGWDQNDSWSTCWPRRSPSNADGTVWTVTSAARAWSSTTASR